MKGKGLMSKTIIFLGKFVVKGLPRAPRGDVKIIISMEIDAKFGIVKLSTEHKRSGIKEVMIMRNENGMLSDDEIARVIGEADKLKIEDWLCKRKM
jgi:molecular chaperone DnaK (HSP70)